MTAYNRLMTKKMPFRPRNPEATKAEILKAAREVFASAGLAGATIADIAEKAGANKRMIYHYYGSKEELFAAVIEDAYSAIRLSEMKLKLDLLPPEKAIEKLVDFTWEYYLKNPEFITLVNSENLHQARHISGNSYLKKLQQAYVGTVQDILNKGAKSGVFRPGIDPYQLCITIAAIGFYYLNNRFTSGELFGFNFTTPEALAKRHQFNVDTVLRLVMLKPPK